MGRLFLFLGPEAGLKNDEIDSLLASMEREFGGVEKRVVYASEVRVADVVAQLESGSLFDGATMVVMRGAEAVKRKDDVALISAWAESGSPNALVLVSDGWSVDAKLDKAVPAKNRKVFRELYAERKEAWLRDFFRREGLELEPDAAALILELVENDTESLRAECSRFRWCFPKGAAVRTADVERILAHNREESAFTLFDAISRPSEPPNVRLENALSILQKITLSKNSSPVMLIAGLSSCFRKLSLWHTLHANGAYPDEISLRKGGFLGKSMQAQYARAAQVWGPSPCAAVSAQLSARDMEIRSSGNALASVQVSLLLYEMVMRNGAPIAGYGEDFA